MPSAIILIGPVRAGKSTIASLLSERLKIPRYPLDGLFLQYFEEMGFDQHLGKQIYEREDFAGLYKSWKPFEIYALERILSDHPDQCVIDLGAGHSVYEDDAHFLRAQQVLAPFKHVILLLPSPDMEEAILIGRERSGGFVSKGFDFDAHFTRHHSNYDLAKITVYTKGKTPQETCEEVLHRLDLESSDESTSGTAIG